MWKTLSSPKMYVLFSVPGTWSGAYLWSPGPSALWVAAAFPSLSPPWSLWHRALGQIPERARATVLLLSALGRRDSGWQLQRAAILTDFPHFPWVLHYLPWTSRCGVGAINSNKWGRYDNRRKSIIKQENNILLLAWVKQKAGHISKIRN